MSLVSDIKLIRTDTTLDLSQKAEKGIPSLSRLALIIPRPPPHFPHTLWDISRPLRCHHSLPPAPNPAPPPKPSPSPSHSPTPRTSVTLSPVPSPPCLDPPPPLPLPCRPACCCSSKTPLKTSSTRPQFQTSQSSRKSEVRSPHKPRTMLAIRE
uniref:Uncharacterized protein n=1 Tax=Physcomitrium patens TaxID=3218 RepID=A0A2K1JQ02_PHYPA|nr:hypothetical protein PHYPA_015972 [Physcomitrium patens]